MRVLLLNGRLADHGGADRWMLGVADGLRERVELVVGVERVELERPDLVVRIIRGLDRRGLRGPGAAAARRWLAEAIDEVAPDVVHANNLVDPDLLDEVARTGRGLLTVQDHRFFCPGPGKVLPDNSPCVTPMGDVCRGCFDDARYAERLDGLTRVRAEAARHMARVTVLSAYMAGELAHVGVRAEVVPPFVHDLPHVPPGERRWHLFAGRLARHKGVEVAVEAARHLAHPLVVAGDGPLAGLVAQAVNVRGEGWVDRAGLARLLAGAHSLWVPSTWAEPFGIVGIEALSRGVPVVASRVGGIPEWAVDGVTLVEPGDVAALARAAAATVGNPCLPREIFDPRDVLERLLGLYHAVAAG